MRRTSILICLGLVVFCLGCATSNPVEQYTDMVVSAIALPEKVVVFVDASYLRRSESYQSYVSISDSMALANVVNDEAERGLTGANMEIMLQKIYFISSYLRREMFVAYEAGAAVVKKQAPLHLNPNVCRTSRMKWAIETLWQEYARIIGGGSTAYRQDLLPSNATHLIGSTYGADTICLVIAVSRKDDDTGEVTLPTSVPATLAHGGSAVVVGLIRTMDGKIVYLSSVQIPGPQRDSNVRRAMQVAFRALPKRVDHESYPVPPLMRRQ